MGKIEKTRVILVWVRLEIEHIVDLVGQRYAPPFKMIEDIVCRKHSISVGSYLKGLDIEIICHPSEICV